MNQKRGVGKATIVTNLAMTLAFTGFRALVVDVDYQANNTSFRGPNDTMYGP
ncbi:MAG: AAA family ATPase [Firmicutes bacterium]|nr:AAA family ATPase [Bacillota bacterium]